MPVLNTLLYKNNVRLFIYCADVRLLLLASKCCWISILKSLSYKLLSFLLGVHVAEKAEIPIASGSRWRVGRFGCTPIRNWPSSSRSWRITVSAPSSHGSSNVTPAFGIKCARNGRQQRGPWNGRAVGRCRGEPGRLARAPGSCQKRRFKKILPCYYQGSHQYALRSHCTGMS